MEKEGNAELVQASKSGTTLQDQFRFMATAAALGVSP
jgi:hypothetical protein